MMQPAALLHHLCKMSDTTIFCCNILLPRKEHKTTFTPKWGNGITLFGLRLFPISLHKPTLELRGTMKQHWTISFASQKPISS
jgi:hypothetical protein